MPRERLSVYSGEPAVRPRGGVQQVVEPGGRLLTGKDLVQQPARFDEGEVIQDGADRLQQQRRLPIEHRRSDGIELADGVAPSVLERCQPSPDLGVLGNWLERQDLVVS